MPPNGTAGLARWAGSGYSRLPSPPASTIANTDGSAMPPPDRSRQPCRHGEPFKRAEPEPVRGSVSRPVATGNAGATRPPPPFGGVYVEHPASIRLTGDADDAGGGRRRVLGTAGGVTAQPGVALSPESAA